MRFFKYVTLFICMLLFFTGCASEKQQKDQQDVELKSYIEHTGEFKPDSCQDVTLEIINLLDINDMIELEKKDIANHYGFNPEYLDDYCAYTSKESGNSTEIAVFYIKDEKHRQEVTNNLISIFEDKASYLRKINKNEHKKISRNPVSLHGQYIAVIVCSSSDIAHKALDEFYE